MNGRHAHQTRHLLYLPLAAGARVVARGRAWHLTVRWPRSQSRCAVLLRSPGGQRSEAGAGEPKERVLHGKGGNASTGWCGAPPQRGLAFCCIE